MTYFATYLESITSTEKTEVEAAMRLSVFGGGVNFDAKPSGDTNGGVWDARNNSSFGSILHFQAGENTTGNSNLIALGTDAGSGNALLISHKNSGAGLRLAGNPGAGIPFYLTTYTGNPGIVEEVYAGGFGVRIDVKNGQGYADGVTTSGSAVLTSATATFTAADVGAPLTQLTTIGGTTPSSSGCIPAGATIVSVESTTSCTMSANATASGTGVRFLVGKIGASGSGNTARDAAATMDILRIRNPDATDRVRWQYGGLTINHGGNVITSNASAAIALALRPSGSLNASIFEVQTNGGTRLSRFDKNGFFMTAKNAAPADADINNSEAAIWFDSTNGAGKLMIKAKTANGTVVTGNLALA